MSFKYGWILPLILLVIASSRALAKEAVLVGAQGSVEVQAPGSRDWTVGILEASLESGTRIKTGTGSGAVVLLPNGEQLKIDALTSITINKNFRNGSEGSSLDLQEGKVWSRVNKLKGSDSSFEIITPTAVCGVRGTSLVMQVDADGGGILTVVDGLVDFSNELGSVSVGASQQSSVSPGQAPTPPKVVDTKHWVEWTLDIRAMGGGIEPSYFGESPEELRMRIKSVSDSDDSPQSWLEIAKINFDQKHYEESKAEFESLLDDNDVIWDAMYGLGLVELSRGGPAAAISEFENLLWSIDDFSAACEACDEDENNYYRAMARAGLGLSYLKSDDVENAEFNFEQAIELSPDDPLALTGLAEAHIRKSETEKAAERLDEALDEAPCFYQALERRSAVFMALNRPEDALEDALEATRCAPYEASAYGTLSRIRFFRNEYEEAREAAEEAVALDQYNPQAHEIFSRLYILDDNLRAAASEALLTLTFDEMNPYANDDLALVYYLYKKYDGAIYFWEKAIEASPDFTIAKIRLAHLYNELEETALAKKAEAIARDVVDADENNPDGWRELARALELQRQYDEAEQSLFRALEIDSQDPAVLDRLAVFYTARHKMDLALDYAIKAVTIQPSNPEYQFDLGRAYEAVDSLDAAASAYLTAITLNPDYDQARYQLGIIYGGQGKYRDALVEMHTAALETPRVISLSEYRGPSRIYGVLGSDEKRYVEGVHTGSRNGYKLNYRLVGTAMEANGHLGGNGDSDSNAGSLLVGYQKNSDSSVTLYADFSREEEGVPLAYTELVENGIFKRDKFQAKRIDLSYKRKVRPAIDMKLRIGNGRTKSREVWDLDAMDTSGVDTTDIDYREYEIGFDVDSGERLTYSLGAFQNRSRPDIRNLYNYTDFIYDDGSGAFVFTPATTIEKFTAFFNQKNMYAKMRYVSGGDEDLYINAGIERSEHNYGGTNTATQIGFDYNMKKRAWLRFTRKEIYTLNYFPRYQPRDGWMSLQDSYVLAPSTETVNYELDYEVRLRDGAFLKINGWLRKSAQLDYSSDCGGDCGMPDTQYKSRGYSAEYEKQASRKTNYFVAVSHNRTEDDTPGSVDYSYVMPYTATDNYSAGIQYFPSSSVTLKLLHNRNGRQYASSDESLEIPAYETTTFQLRYDPTIDRSYMLTIRNLFDEEYENPYKYRQPGRTWELGAIRWF